MEQYVDIYIYALIMHYMKASWINEGKKPMRSEALSPGELYSLPDGEQGIYIYIYTY